MLVFWFEGSVSKVLSRVLVWYPGVNIAWPTSPGHLSRGALGHPGTPPGHVPGTPGTTCPGVSRGTPGQPDFEFRI